MFPQPHNLGIEKTNLFIREIYFWCLYWWLPLTVTHKLFFLFFFTEYATNSYKGYIAFGPAADLHNYVTVCVIVNLQLSEVKCVLLKVLVAEQFMSSLGWVLQLE